MFYFGADFIVHFILKIVDFFSIAFSAYFAEFTKDDHVALVVVTRLDDKSRDLYAQFVKNFTAEKRTRSTSSIWAHSLICAYMIDLDDASSLPKVFFLTDLVPYSHFPALYESADAFVLPSHGEGWGLPLMEGHPHQYVGCFACSYRYF